MGLSADRLQHDMRNGMNNLRLSLSVLEIETDPAEVAGWLESISRAADKCIRVIDEAGLAFAAAGGAEASHAGADAARRETPLSEN